MSYIELYWPYALAGMAGAVIRSLLIHKDSVYLWRLRHEGDRIRLDLGIISSMLIGATVGVIVDQSPGNAFIWAVAGPYLIEELVKMKTGKTMETEDTEETDSDV